MAEAARTEGPKALGDIGGLIRLRNRWGKEARKLWWNDPEAEEWGYVEAFFLTPFPPVRREDVEADPFAFDHALQEWLRCDRCTAKRGTGAGYSDCPLEYPDPRAWPNLPGGSKNHYMDIKLLDDGTRWAWVKRRCTTKEQRALEIGRRLKAMRDLPGGLLGVEVDEPSPFDEQPEGLCA